MKKLAILALLLIIALAGASVWWINGKSPAYPASQEFKIFVVGKGDGVREIANNLKNNGLIRSRIVFFLVVKKLGLDKKIQAGDFRLTPAMTAEEIAINLTHGTLDIWITVPEGKRSEEISQILAEKLDTFSPS